MLCRFGIYMVRFMCQCHFVDVYVGWEATDSAEYKTIKLSSLAGKKFY